MPGPSRRPKRVGRWGARRPIGGPKKYKPMKPLKHRAMTRAIQLRVDRANDRSGSVKMVSNRPVNPNRQAGRTLWKPKRMAKKPRLPKGFRPR